MNRKIICKSILAAMLVSGSAMATADEATQAGSLGEAVSGGTPYLQLRARYENDTQSNLSQTAQAFTLRDIMGWQTKSYNNFSVNAQAIGVVRLMDQYNSNKYGISEPGKGNYPVVTDPDYLNVNQLYLDWTGQDKTVIRAGRQAVTLDDGRFIGIAGLRQVMRTFTGISLENKSLSDTEFFVAHFQDFMTPPADKVYANVDVLHANYKFTPGESISVYDYLFDHVAADSSSSLGLRVNGERAVSADWKLLYTAESAKQSAYKSGVSAIDASYTHLGAGAGIGDWSARIDRESFSSNNGLYAFQTPFGNSHQGAADLFGGIPSDGLEDTTFGLGGKVMEFSLSAGYHILNATSNFASGAVTGSQYAKELDIGVGYALSKKVSLSADYVDFREADVRTAGRYPDMRKMWLTMVYEY